MKRIAIGALVATIIYFGYQSAMWMGGFHDDFTSYTPQHEELLADINKYQLAEGLYTLPGDDPSKDYTYEEQKAIMKERTGKPWAMLFYHPAMADMEMGYILMGVLYSLIACIIASLVVYHGNFGSYGARFIVSMGFGIFTLLQGVLGDMNWWSFPWSFIKPQVMDLTIGWGLASLWLAFYVKKK